MPKSLWLIACTASALWAVDWKALQPPQGCVGDLASVVDASTRTRIESYCSAIHEATGVRMTFVTIQSLQGEPSADVASTLARSWNNSDGILWILVTQDHRHQLEIAPALQATLPPGLSNHILDEMRPALRRGEHGEAVMAAAEVLGAAIAAARHAAVPTRLPRNIRPHRLDAFPWPLAIGSLVLAGWLMRAGGPRGYGWAGGRGFLPWLALGAATTRSTWGSRGTGGFGAYDSGDTFAGFGGGDFGGRASSDW